MVDRDIMAELHGADNADKALARAFLMGGQALIINLALQNNWSRSLEDVARGYVSNLRRTGHASVSVRTIDGLVWLARDVAYYQRHGQDLLTREKGEVIAEREKRDLWFPVRADFSQDRKKYRIVRVEEDRDP